MTDHTTVTDRLTWLAYRADWRRRYKEATLAIRSVKGEIARHRRLRRELGTEGVSHQYAADSLQCGLWIKRRDARWLMDELTEAKKHKAELLAARAEAADQAPLAA